MYLQPQSARLTPKAIARMAGYAIYIPRFSQGTDKPWGWVDTQPLTLSPFSHNEVGFATEGEAALDCCIKNGLIDNVTYESKETNHAPI